MMAMRSFSSAGSTANGADGAKAVEGGAAAEPLAVKSSGGKKGKMYTNKQVKEII